MKKFLDRTRFLLNKSAIHPIFILLLIWFIISGRILSFFSFILVLIIHEFGHYIFAKKLGYKLSKFRLLPFGAELNYSEQLFESRDEVLIAFAGPLFNIFFSVLTVCLWWLFPSLYSISSELVFESTVLALINLLPAYPLDGGRILLGLINGKFDRKNSLKFLKILNIFFVIFFILCFIISCLTDYNPTFILMSFFLLSGLLEIESENRYELVGLVKKCDKNFGRVVIKNVNLGTRLIDIVRQIEPRRRTIFLLKNNNKIITEDYIMKLSMIYPLDSNINEIIKKKNSTK